MNPQKQIQLHIYVFIYRANLISPHLSSHSEEQTCLAGMRVGGGRGGSGGAGGGTDNKELHTGDFVRQVWMKERRVGVR